MNFNDILNGVLNSVSNTGNQTKADLGSVLSSVLAGARSSADEIKQGNTDTIAKVGGSAALMGILSMVLGRNGGASLTKLGSLAALGSLAYKAYQDYQQSQAASADNLPQHAFDASHNTNTGEAILRTMIAAAASDGSIDEHEKQVIAQEAGDNPEVYQWLNQELSSPATPAQIAQLVGNDTALASQVYLAARLVCKELSRKEIVFLSQLAEALGLNDALVEQLEKQAGF